VQSGPERPAQDSTVGVLLGKGDGTFAPQTTYATGFTPFSVAVGDFNGDGILDLAVANDLLNTVGVR
jgi:FG-GAP-like repeat